MAARSSIIWASVKYFFIELIGDVLYFPLWWYTVGFSQLLISRAKNLRSLERHLALGLLARSLFMPMFGQYDRAGRIISFFMRLVILIGRVIYFIVLTFVNLLLIIVWLALPVLITVRLFSFFL
ncbi:MAG: hypothetical protein V1846_05235 [Candidatus Komeilibacteria bacterium]